MKNVYMAIQEVAAKMAVTGIGKTRTNAEQKFKFRGIDETLNALAPVLSEVGLVILPRILTRTLVERQTRSGNPLFSVVVEAEFDFVSAEDGSTHTIRTFGEAMDTGDKATNKAMSIAYKYAAFLAFCIPVEGMGEDADTHTHDVAPAAVPEPIGFAEWLADMTAMSETADLDTMRDSYKSSAAKYRHYLETTQKATLDKLVDRARQNAPLPVL
jgi:hypothetical protein